jgi:hypothetical protein
MTPTKEHPVIAPRLLRPLLAVAVTASVLGASSALAAPKLGPNLAPNASFEEAVEATTIDGNYNPVPPVGWAFEGATVLFDYKTNVGRTGKKMVAISGTLAGGKQLCDGSSGADKCTANPAFPVTDQVDKGTSKTYSIRPFWTNDKGVPVKAGKTYRFSAYASLPSINPAAGTPGEGAATQVRWLDASGKVLSIAEGGKLVKGTKRILGFKLVTADLKAPAGAVGAELMLGHTYYTHTGTQVAFDDVAFQQLG